MDSVTDSLFEQMRFRLDKDSSWFVPLEKALDGVTAPIASWRPKDDFNSIWQIVNHLTFWTAFVSEVGSVLGAPRNTVHLQPYHRAWKSMFERDEAQLRSVIGAYVVDIQHVGSTSIVGLDAKPMIDIAIGVATFDHVDEIASELKTLGYLRLRVKLDGKVVFAKDTDKGRTHYLHLEIYNGVHWNAHLLFRDYLRAHPEAVESYLHLKRELAVQFSDDVKSYTDRKKAFVDAILEQAKKG